jgi:hypothetical protein
MSGTPRSVLHQDPDISTEQVRDARARAWAFVFRCYQSKENPAAGPSERGDNDGKAKGGDSADGYILPH